MKIVYIIQSQKDSSIYTGVTSNLDDRMNRHNHAEVKTTRDKVPWKLICHFNFENNQTAYNFERYLKSGSGRAFLKKHLI